MLSWLYADLGALAHAWRRGEAPRRGAAKRVPENARTLALADAWLGDSLTL
jgi:hypothetical protein